MGIRERKKNIQHKSTQSRNDQQDISKNDNT